MGDMADFMIDQSIDFSVFDDSIRPLKCSKCGKTALLWHEIDGKWRIVESKNMRPHKCPPERIFKYLKEDKL